MQPTAVTNPEAATDPSQSLNYQSQRHDQLAGGLSSRWLHLPFDDLLEVLKRRPYDDDGTIIFLKETVEAGLSSVGINCTDILNITTGLH